MHRILRRVVIVSIVVGFVALFFVLQPQRTPASIAAPETPIIPTPTPTDTPVPLPTATPTPLPTSTPYVPESEQVRSTYYDGTDSAQVEYDHQSQFDAGIPVTIEAWVYRRDGSRCETILSHDYTASYWLGFCPQLRFYRNDNKSADATDTVPVGDWVHVAASYDGSTVRFYIDGEPAGSEQLANDGTTIERPLILGGDWGGYHFDGFLDEVRLWSVARTQQEIRDGMFEEIRTHQDLQAVFPHGGRHEALSGVDGDVGSGTQESVFGMLPRDLQVPKAVISPNLDGEIGRGSEYAGAEQIVIRNRNGDTVDDTRAHLIRTDTDLYVGIEYPFDTTDGRPHEETWLGLMLDPDYSRESVADSDEVQAKMVLDADDENANWLVGDGSGGFEDCESAIGASNCPTLGDEWDVAKYYADDVITGPPLSVEYRISKELLGEWTEVDGLALAQFAIDDPDDVAPAPGDAVVHSPLTWARVTYTEGSASLPTAHIAGTVYNSLPDSQPALKAGHDVYLIDKGGGAGILYSTQTDSEGYFSFDVPVPENQALRLQMSSCSPENCQYAEANTWSDGIQPTATYERIVDFPGCTASDCDYAIVEFYARDPIGPVSLDSATPNPPTATMKVRTNPVTTTPPSHVTIHGENLHSETNVYLSPYTFNDDPSTWVLYPATIVDRANDETWVKVEVPGIPKRTKVNTENDLTYPSLSREWRWVVEDTWDRLNAERWTTVGRFHLTPPPYPQRNGFGFENHGERPTLSEFLAVYGENAYICIGAFGVCATHVPDPLYWIAWEPIYTGLVSSSGGSCVGLSATSLFMYHGDLQPEQFDADVSYVAGFIDGYGYDSNAQWEYAAAGPALGPPEPANLWAEVRKNHGVQFSSEFIHELLADTAGDAALKGDPMTQYDEIQQGVFDNVISMVPSVGRGHAVTPYGIDGNRVHVYDNNHPLDANRYIDFDAGTNDYIFQRDGEEWRGDGIHTYPLDIWRNERTAPIDLFEGVYTIVLGAADGHYTTDDGDEWGWRADGTFVDDMPGAAAIPPLGPSPTDTHNVPLVLPMTDTAPTVDVNTRNDGEYTYHAAQNKTVLQLEVFDAAANNTDQVTLDYEQQTLNAFRFTPEETTEDLVPKVGMTPGERQRLMFRWGGLEVQGDGSVAFEELTDQHGTVFTNTAGSETSHRLVVDSVDGAAETSGTYVFGPFTIPSGAVHRTTIADWPDSTQLRSEVDVDGDGTFDETKVVTGRECASDDANGNGLPDACESGAGSTQHDVYLPAITKQ